MITVMPPISAMELTPPSPIEKPVEEDRVQTGAQVDAGDHHRRRVDQRGDGRGAGHGVGQPRVQRELARLADDREHQRGRAPQQEGVTRRLDARVLCERGASTPPPTG